MRALLTSILLIALVAPHADAQRIKRIDSLDDATARGGTLDSIVKNLAKRVGDSKVKQGSSSRTAKMETIVWLVDNTVEMVNLEQHGKLADAIAEHFNKPTKAHVSHAIVLIDKKLQLVQKPTSDVDAVCGALRGVATQPESAIRDTMGAIRGCASYFGKRSGNKHMVLFTIENSDTERELEATVNALKRARMRLYVLSREGIYSDPYWARRAYEAKKHAPILLKGTEAPMQEYPHTWLWHYDDPHASAPAGFGIYGLNRLVCESGGAYYVYDPVISPSTGGNCRALYHTFRLKLYEPAAVSRAKYGYMLSRHRGWHTIRQAWTEAYKMGIVGSLPPELGGSKEAGGSNQATRNGYSLSVSTLSRMASRAQKDREELQGWIQRLAKSGRSSRKTPHDRRATATADNLRFSLMVARFNLLQLIAFADYVEKVKGGQPLSALEAPIIPPGTSQNDLAISYYNRTFCQDGRRAMEETRWLGGKQADREMKQLVSTLDKLQAEHSGTPYEVVLERNAVVIFRLYKIYRGTARTVPRPRQRESSDQEKPVTTTQGPSRPARARTGGASRTGSGGATTR